jgi:heat shock protein HslJ
MSVRAILTVIIAAGVLSACAAEPAAESTGPAEGSAPSAEQPATPPNLEGTEWRLIQLGEEEVAPEGPQGEPSLTLDAAAQQVSGTGGCNRFSGSYTLDGAALSFGPLAGTRMMCPEGMDLELGFLDALARTRSFSVGGEALELYDDEGGLVARLESAG